MDVQVRCTDAGENDNEVQRKCMNGARGRWDEK
jgi:hypothetical protein